MFTHFFGAFEYALTQEGFAKNRDVAEADWPAFARALGAEFFEHVRNAGIAQTLIDEPPRQFMRGGMWMPEQPNALANVNDLFVLGVCRVRNNVVHGKKHFYAGEGNERAHALVYDATAVLEAALDARPSLQDHLNPAPGR